MKRITFLHYLFLFGICITVSTNCMSEDEISVPVSSDEEITVRHFPADGKYLLVWLAPEYGFRVAHKALAQMLAQQHIEIWQSNIVESLFLPQGSRSLKKLDGTYVADLIEYAHKQTGKKILIVGDSYATIPALTGARQWQTRNIESAYFIGAILFSPYTYAYIPPLGLKPSYMPIISATNIPVMIYQAKNGGTINHFQMLLNTLQQHGAPVYSQITPDVMSLFYEKTPTQEMKNNAKLLAINIPQMIPVLEKHKVPNATIPVKIFDTEQFGLDVTLKSYKGQSKPEPIHLQDIYGNTFIKDNFAGQITVVNFWATWCPPCVEEIPSLNRLKKKMANSSFELISINYAEDKQHIVDFMKRVKVEFPVLLDTDGETAKKMNVITYPSTFIIDTKGNIKYGVNAAIEWDNPDVIRQIQDLQ